MSIERYERTTLVVDLQELEDRRAVGAEHVVGRLEVARAFVVAHRLQLKANVVEAVRVGVRVGLTRRLVVATEVGAVHLNDLTDGADDRTLLALAKYGQVAGYTGTTKQHNIQSNLERYQRRRYDMHCAVKEER